MFLRRIVRAPLLAMSLPLLWCFGWLFTGARQCAYRDTAHFYYPLYAWISECWSRGEVPLWNPQDNLGIPIAAEATSAVFYPGQLIFALPLSYPLKFNLYLLTHLVLALAGAYALARHFLTDRREDSPGPLPSVPPPTECGEALPRLSVAWGAALCGISYVLGGAVLFQYCNVVFLVGAAWLPWGLLAADHMLIQRRWTGSLALGTCLALMTLGGDPQMAYHTGMLAALLAWVRYRTRTHSPAVVPVSSTSRAAVGLRRYAFVLLLAAASWGAALAAVQIVPAVSWTTVSRRDAPRHERSLLTRWLGPAPPDSHQHQLYDFSVAPWRLLECLWPNVSGRMFPVNQRWLSAVGAEDRIWTPTLYLGLIPLLLGGAAWRIRSWDYRVRWLSLVAGLAVIASFGWYGPGCLFRELQRLGSGAPPTIDVGEPTGGLYWLMVHVLPGYAYFRYPAKWLVIASLAVALLAALGLEEAVNGQRRRLRAWLCAVVLASIVATLLVAAMAPWWNTWFDQSLPDELFGPLDVRGAWRCCLLACLRTAVLGGVLWWLLRPAGISATRLAQTLVWVTAIELGSANGVHILTAPANVMQSLCVLTPTTGPSSAEDDQSLDPAVGATDAPGSLVRIYRPPRRRWVPPHWLGTSSEQRGREVMAWDRATLFPRYHLLDRWGSVHSMTTMVPRDYDALLQLGGGTHPPPCILDALGARYLLLSAGEAWPGGRLSATPSAAENVRVWHNATALPRAWIVYDFEIWPTALATASTSLEEHLRHIYLPGDVPRDLRRWACVESTGPITVPASPPPRFTAAAVESCRVVSESGGTVIVDATLPRTGLIVLNNYYHPGWSAEVLSTDSSWRPPVLRANGLMQGVLLPSGTHRIVLHYAPPRLYVAAGVSCVAWLGAALIAVLAAMRHYAPAGGGLAQGEPLKSG